MSPGTEHHPLLLRQLRRKLGVADAAGLPSLLSELANATGISAEARALVAGLGDFLASVSETYRQADRDLDIAQRSLALSSGELSSANEKLRQEAIERDEAIHRLRETMDRLVPGSRSSQDEHEALVVLARQMDGLVTEIMEGRRESEVLYKELRDRQFALDQHAIVSITDAAGNIIYANDRFCDISGYAREELLGRNHRILKSNEHDDAFFADLWNTITQGKVWHGEVKNQARSGVYYWVAATVVPFLDDNGLPFQYISIRTDITAQKRLEARLDAEQRFLHSMMDTLGEGVYTMDAEGRCTFMNKEGQRILGWSWEQLEGRNLHDLIHYKREDGTPLPREQCPALLSVSKGEIYRSESDMYIRQDGTPFPVAIVASPLVGGGLTGSVAAFQDITERKRLMEENQRAREAAEHANRSKSEFLATMSHEIRTPMNGIIGMTDLTLDTELTPVQRDYLNLVKSSADSLLEIINDILDFSKIEAGRVDLEHIPFRVRDLMSTTLKPLGLRAYQKGLELAYEANPDVPDTLVGDPGRLRQIIVNLVGNAIKFSDKGYITVRITPLSIEQNTSVLKFSVSDQGIGIPLEKQLGIFEAFTQADTSTTRRYGGTGLGLAICTRLVHAMSGEIGVDSNPGKGSTFFFTARFEHALESEREESIAPLPVELAHLPVLVVDDNATNRKVLSGMATRWGMSPEVAENASQALSLLGRRQSEGLPPFKLVLMDAMMPDIDGYALTALIREVELPFQPLIMMLTSGGLRGDAERCRELGIAAYLTKPVGPNELRAAIEDAFVLKRQGQQELVTRHTMEEKAAGQLHVLLAEDNLVNQKLAVALLKKWGHTVSVASNGEEAVAMSARERFDLILMDVQMPLLSGLEATRQIREREAREGGHIRIVAMTANAMAGDRERCLESGMDDYVSKPLKAAVLAESLRGERYVVSPPLGTLPDEEPLAFDYGAALAGMDPWVIGIITRPFREDWPMQLVELKDAVDREDRATVRRIAHTLKGLLGQFGAKPAEQLARKLETVSLVDALATAQVEVELLEAELRLLEQALAKFSTTNQT